MYGRIGGNKEHTRCAGTENDSYWLCAGEKETGGKREATLPDAAPGLSEGWVNLRVPCTALLFTLNEEQVALCTLRRWIPGHSSLVY